MAPKLDADVIESAYASYTAFANTRALTTTLKFATEPHWLHRSSGSSELNGVSDLAGYVLLPVHNNGQSLH